MTFPPVCGYVDALGYLHCAPCAARLELAVAEDDAVRHGPVADEACDDCGRIARGTVACGRLSPDRTPCAKPNGHEPRQQHDWGWS